MSEKIIEIILEMLKKYNAEFIYIFGSYAKGLENKESDIDIAFFSDKSYGEYEVFQSAQEISAILKKDIDLVQLKNSTTVFQKEIVENGQIIYEKNKIDREKFELSVIKKYFTLKEDRKEIIDNYEVELWKMIL